MVERNAGVPEDRRIVFRIGIHLGDVVEESDGDLMGDGVNIAARLEGIAAPGAICLSEDAYRQVKGRLDLAVTDLGPTQLKNIAEPVRAYSLQVGVPAVAKLVTEAKPQRPKKHSALPALAGGIAALLVVVAAGALYFLGARGPAVEASAWLRKSIDANRNRPLAFFLLAACLAHLGRIDEARREVKAGLAVDPKFTLGRFRAGAQSDNAVYLTQRARVAEGMRLAGVPEG